MARASNSSAILDCRTGTQVSVWMPYKIRSVTIDACILKLINIGLPYLRQSCQFLWDVMYSIVYLIVEILGHGMMLFRKILGLLDPFFRDKHAEAVSS